MNRARSLALCFAVLIAAVPASRLSAQSRGAAAGPGVRACSLLPRGEVKRVAALPDPLGLFEKMPPEEEPVGRGSSCNYPGIHVQVDPFDWTTVEAQRSKNRAQYEAVAGVGEAAFLRANKAAASLEFAELYAKIGSHVLTIQMDVPDGGSTASVRPGLVALAKALAAKLQ